MHRVKIDEAFGLVWPRSERIEVSNAAAAAATKDVALALAYRIQSKI